MQRGAANWLPRAFLCLLQMVKATQPGTWPKNRGVNNVAQKILRDHCRFGLTNE
jgi:hypothetical protein